MRKLLVAEASPRSAQSMSRVIDVGFEDRGDIVHKGKTLGFADEGLTTREDFLRKLDPPVLEAAKA